MPDGSYPIGDREDLTNAVRAVGRGGASHNAIRRHIMKRARALGASNAIPDNWNSDGSLRSREIDTSTEPAVSTSVDPVGNNDDDPAQSHSPSRDDRQQTTRAIELARRGITRKG